MTDGSNPREHPLILLVDDDQRLQDSLRDFLAPFGYTIASLPNGNEICARVAEIRPDIILLDVMMPGEDGFAVLRRLRAASPLPVLMLTARGEDTDRIVGLELGADDYLSKPFNPRELLARIKAVLRRAARQAEAGETGSASGELAVGELILDLKRQRLKHKAQSTPLTTTECRIIHAFMQKAGQVLSRDALLTLAFGDAYYGCDRNIDVYISRMRNTLRKIGVDPRLIQTVWGSGYRLVKD